jgi:HD-like signal output (HDOD) protein
MFSFFKSDPKERLKKILGHCELPRFRKTVFETLRRLRDPDSQPNQISEVMSLDPDLTSKVMRTVNSNAYAPRTKINSLDHAIMMMGRSNLERIVMMLGARTALPQRVPAMLNLPAFWRRSAKRAVLAKAVADAVAPAQGSLSFTAGFLQDICLPLLVMSRESDYGPVLTESLKSGKELHLLEQETFGWDHAELAAIVCDEWEMPEDLGICLRDQHLAESEARPDPVYFVSSHVDEQGGAWTATFCQRVTDRCQLSDERLKGLISTASSKMNELISIIE